MYAGKASEGGERFLFLSERVPYFSHTHGQGYTSYRFPTVALTDSRVRNVVPTALERITARGYQGYPLCFPFPILNATTMTGRKPYKFGARAAARAVLPFLVNPYYTKMNNTRIKFLFFVLFL